MTVYRATHGRSTSADLVNLVGTVLALILAAHVTFWLLHANTAHPLVRWVAHTSDVIALWFVNLVDTGNPTFSVIVNYGLAAVFWLFVTGAIAGLLRRVG